jgi:hypothetical protein
MRKAYLIGLIGLFVSNGFADAKPTPTNEGRAGIDAFNRAMIDGTLRMDNAALGAQWESDGISLLPSTEPVVGRAAITKMVADIMASMPGAKMISFDMTCSDIEIYGDYASEWCTEHQVVGLPGKPNFDGWGKILFVLHRGADNLAHPSRNVESSHPEKKRLMALPISLTSGAHAPS